MHRFSTIIALFFLGAYLWSATPFREVLKLPALMSHLRHHINYHQESGLISFLIDHYAKENGTDEDAAEDRRLPFKSMDAIVNGTTLAVSPPASFQVIIQLLPVEKNSFEWMNDNWCGNAFTQSIWQPPKYSFC
jgi:hypothetical protein